MQPSCLKKSPETEFDAHVKMQKLWLLEHIGSARNKTRNETQDFSVETRTLGNPHPFTMELESLMPEPHSKNIL